MSLSWGILTLQERFESEKNGRDQTAGRNALDENSLSFRAVQDEAIITVSLLHCLITLKSRLLDPQRAGYLTHREPVT